MEEKKAPSVFEINSVPYGSTGRIMFDIADKVEREGGRAYTACSYTKPRGIHFPTYHYQIGGISGKLLHTELAKRTGKHGMYSRVDTALLVRKIKQSNPDIIHMHNMHGWFINIPLFFDFLKDYGKPVVWTLHDCWTYTGHCTYYSMRKCDKWKVGCQQCEAYGDYPMAFRDDSSFQYSLKKKCFSGIGNVTIVTPSRWLKEEVEESFLGQYPVRVINNGINTEVFRNVENTFRKDYGIKDDQIMLLGVAFDWGARKGLPYFVQLAGELGDRYRIVMVGVSEQEKSRLPSNIIALGGTDSQKQLAEIYASADYFLNLTQEDNFPTVNIESLACGTPVITFPTGGSPEIADENTGWVVKDFDELVTLVGNLCRKDNELIQKCVERGNTYAKEDKFAEYVALYRELI